ncbi:hypothetical protein SAMN04488023_10623 [Pedobacter rhizosphaerae]|uniref:Uncharacterized protein n=1 Tax=Pedobacter rhizosphaerae TaxID=390241 RepID=A0A1H9ML15_9SPHI|nr:hypothetical protein SAMN04488023_10623 [Pedobacter rhizosphaerae]
MYLVLSKRDYRLKITRYVNISELLGHGAAWGQSVCVLNIEIRLRLVYNVIPVNSDQYFS